MQGVHLTKHQQESIVHLYKMGTVTMQEVASQVQCGIYSVHKYLTKARINTNMPHSQRGKKARKNHFDQDYFEHIDTRDKAYIFGWILSDGTINKKSSSNSHQVRLKITDIELLQQISDRAFEGRTLLEDKKLKPHHKERRVLVLSSSKICSDLERHGCIQNKTYNLQFPNIQDDLMPDFIRGFFDGDGCMSVGISNKRTGCLVGEVKIVATTDFLSGLKLFLSKKGINSYLERDKRISDTRINNIRIRTVSSIFNFYNYIYKDMEGQLFLKRKLDKFHEFIPTKNLPVYDNV